MPKVKIRKHIIEPSKNNGGTAMMSAIDLQDSDSFRAVVHDIPEAEEREESGQEVSAVDQEADNLIRWQLSEWPQAWVEEHAGSWNHEEWLELLAALADTDFWPMRPDGIGRVLEDEARTLIQQIDNLNRWKDSGLAQDWVAARNGEWNHEDWRNLLSTLEGTEFWPMKAAKIGMLLEELKGSFLTGDTSEITVCEAPLEVSDTIEVSVVDEEMAVALPPDSAQYSTITLLLATGADVNAPDSFGQTPLHRAAFEGREDIVRLLLSKGAYVHAATNAGKTAMHFAAAGSHQSVIKLLLAYGADINVADDSGVTPLHLAILNEEGTDLFQLAEDGEGALLSTDAGTAAFPDGEQYSEQGFEFRHKNGKPGDELG